jgi:hypothetical protein
MKDWQRIRLARTDLTDYVIHFTKLRGFFYANWPDRPAGFAKPLDVFLEILDEGFIRPTFVEIPLKRSASPRSRFVVRTPPCV